MKKTIVITVLAFVLTLGSANAKPIVDSPTDYKIEKTTVFEVNPFCVSIAKGDLETVKKLISLGEDINRRSNGMTPLMYAARFNRVEILKLLIENGAKVKDRCDKGYNALKYATLSKATESQKVLKSLMSKKKKRA